MLRIIIAFFILLIILIIFSVYYISVKKISPLIKFILMSNSIIAMYEYFIKMVEKHEYNNFKARIESDFYLIQFSTIEQACNYFEEIILHALDYYDSLGDLVYVEQTGILKDNIDELNNIHHKIRIIRWKNQES